MDAIRRALIVANDEYDDPKLKALRGPSRDADELSRVLGDRAIGSFEVDVSRNEPAARLRRRLAEFFADRSPDDALLLHFSCHGIKDDDGVLYFATPDTEVRFLDATAIASDFLRRSMTGSRSRRIALFLDCCYSGAFARGAAVRGGDAIDIADRFGGRGHVVITASSAMEYSFEGDDVSGVGRASVFTTALVQGLQNGAADRDGDGVVSIDELYEYVYARVQEETPSQTPRKWTYDLEGDFVVAMNPNATSVASEVLPPALIEAMTNPFASVRKVAVEEFARLRTSGSSLLAEAAERALARLVDDSDPDVSRAAATALATGDSEPQGERPTDPRAPEARRPSDRGQPPTPDGSTVPRSGRRSAAKRRSDGSIVPEVATDTPDMRARREQLWAHIRELGFGPHSGWRTWYHPSIAGARFTDKKNNINFERFLPDGKWHVWETFPLYSSADDLAIQSSISFVSQHVDEHSPMWQQWVDSLPPDDRRMWMNAYAAGKANPWY